MLLPKVYNATTCSKKDNKVLISYNLKQFCHHFYGIKMECNILNLCEVNLIEVLEIMVQMGPYIIFLKPETNKDYFRLYFELLEKSYRGRHHTEISRTNTKTMITQPDGTLLFLIFIYLSGRSH